MPTIIDVPPEWRTRLQVARDPGFLAGVGAALLMCAPVLPGLSRVVVLPALLLAPGYAFLRLLGQAAGLRSISLMVPVSLVLAVCASLLLDVSGIRLGPVSLGLLLGAVTALFLAGSYGRRLLDGWPASPKPSPPQQPLPPHEALSPLSPRQPPQPRQPPPPKLGPWGQPDFSDTEPIPVIKDPKDPWSEAGVGRPVIAYVADSEHDEAAFVAEEVNRLTDKGGATPGQVAVFYRTNAQSRLIEEVFIRAGMPYMIVGGVPFYERREVQDLLAYLRLIANPEDEVSLRRVLNVPRRGIGARTQESVAALAHRDQASFAAALIRPGEVPGLSPSAIRAIESFNELLAGLRADADAGLTVAEIAEAVLERSGYLAQLEASGDRQDAGRVENLRELVAGAREFDVRHGQAALPDPDPDTDTAGVAPGSLADFLAQVSLVAEADQVPEDADHDGKLTLMTLGTGKGLEFPVVFLIGMEENAISDQRSANGPQEFQKEHRLAYGGIIRAERRLYLTMVEARTSWGRPEYRQQSRFLAKIPGHLTGWRRGQGSAVAPAAQRPARQASPSPPNGGGNFHDGVALTAAGDHPPASSALRAMFTRDFVYLGVSALQVVLTALITPILTRRLGAGQFGQVSLAMTVAQLLGVTFNLGFPFAAQKVFAGKDGDHRSRGVLAISAVLAVAASLVAVLAAPAWGPAVGLDQVLDARLAALWAACFALTLTALALLRSRDKLRMATLVAAVQSVGAQAAGVLLLYWWAPNVTSYLWGLIIGQGTAAVVGLLALRPAWSVLTAIRPYAGVFLFGLPMVPQQLSGYILGLGDRVVIAHVLGSAAVGRYSVAYNVGSLGFILLVLVGWAWMPRIYAVEDRVARSRLLASSRDLMNLLLIPVVCGLAAGAPVVLAVWVPQSFNPAELTPVVAIVAVCTFPFGQFQANLRALMSEGRTGQAAVATLAAAAVNIGLNVVMVPFLGITGSAIATVLSYALCARLTRPPVSSGLQVPGASVQLRVLIGGAIAATLAIGVLPASPVWLGIRLVIGAGALAAFAWLLRRAMTGFETSGRLVTLMAGSSTKAVR